MVRKIRLAEKYPVLAAQFDATKNKEIVLKDLGVSDTRGIWWICEKCNYSWKASVSTRTYGKKSNCPRCAIRRRRILLEECFPHLAQECDRKNNTININDVGVGNKGIVAWKCQNCQHRWRASVSNRTYNKSKCPKCSKEGKGRNI